MGNIPGNLPLTLGKQRMCAEERVMAEPFLPLRWGGGPRNIALGVIRALVDACPCPFRYSLLRAAQMLLQWHPLTALKAAAIKS